MTDTTFEAIAMTIYFVAMIMIGLWAYVRTSDLDDYMLAGRDLNPFVAALSAGASDMSGWLLMGLPGALYASGMVESWIAVGLTVGALANWLVVAPRLRSYTEVAGNSITIPSFLDNRLHDSRHLMRWAAGVIILVFFTFYVSSAASSSSPPSAWTTAWARPWWLPSQSCTPWSVASWRSPGPTWSRAS